MFPEPYRNIARLILYNPHDPTINNRTICAAWAVIGKGPGIDIELVPGFDGDGPATDHAGLSEEQPIVFEVDLPEGLWSSGSPRCTSEFLDAYGSSVAAGGPVYHLNFTIYEQVGGGGRQVFLFNTDYVPDGPGIDSFDGRKRYTFSNSQVPDDRWSQGRNPALFPQDSSVNPATDQAVVITLGDNVTTIGGPYPAVEVVDAAASRLRLTWDYVEGYDVRNWVRNVIQNGTSGTNYKATVAVTPLGGDASSTTTYAGCFPVRYELRGEFVQLHRLKEELVIECDATL